MYKVDNWMHIFISNKSVNTKIPILTDVTNGGPQYLTKLFNRAEVYGEL